MRILEEWGRRRLFTTLMHRSGRRRTVDPDELGARGRRVLFIAEDAIGDTILTMPAIRAIAEAHPHNEVDVATWPVAGQLFDAVPYVGRVIPFPRYDKRRLQALRAIRDHGPYDAVVDGMVLRRHVRSRSFAMMLGSGARFWIGEGDRGSDYLLNVRVPRATERTPHLDRMLAFAGPFGAINPPKRPLLVVRPGERAAARRTWDHEGSGMRILMNISTNGPERHWAPLNFAAVAAHVRRRRPNARFIVVGMEHDHRLVEYIAAAGNGQPIIPSLRELIALIESADLVISPDTAACHLASAFRRPLVSIHNSGKENWHPFDAPGVRVIGPNGANFDGIGPNDVARAVDQVLNDLVLNTKSATSPSHFSPHLSDQPIATSSWAS
jgi:ADP-heptose:LPS heptosyltransferase